MRIVRPAGWSFSPLDEELGLLPHRYTPRLVEQIVQVGVSVPFSEAHRLVRNLIGAVVPANTIRRLTEGAGRRALQLETEQVAQARDLAFASSGAMTIVDRLQQVSVDGAMVPLVAGEWAEVKSLAIGRVEPTANGPRARALSYFARLADHETFRAQARVEFDRRQTEEAREVVAVTDGAEWIQGFLDEHCPDAVRIIDWGHAASYVGQAGQALFGPGTAECGLWVEAQLHLLWTADPKQVVDELARRETASGLAVVRTARQYLEKRLDQLRYAAFRQGGYPVGSGIVESANKVVVETRLKGRGMHWSRANVNPMLVLRCTSASQRWEQRWPQIHSALRRTHGHRPIPVPSVSPELQASAVPATAGAPTGVPPPVPHAPTIINGKPTRAHPWSRFPACRAKL